MEILITSIVAFASTNIDDIFILMLFFASHQYKTKQVVLGQYLGIIGLIAISLIGSLIGLIIDLRFIGLLGLLPIYLGIRGIIQLFRRTKESEHLEAKMNTSKSNKTLSVAAVTFANGGDNIGIYIPLFATLSSYHKGLMIGSFIAMVAVWCMVARYLSRHPAIARTIQKYGHIITPVVLILLGVYILYESRSFQLI